MKHSSKLLIIALGSLTAGIANGLLGAGGGILLIFIISPILCGSGIASGSYSKKDVMAISLAVMLPISAVSATRYGVMGHIDFSYVVRIILPAVLGGITGGVLLSRLRESAVMKIFALLLIYAGISMIVR